MFITWYINHEKDCLLVTSCWLFRDFPAFIIMSAPFFMKSRDNGQLPRWSLRSVCGGTQNSDTMGESKNLGGDSGDMTKVLQELQGNAHFVIKNLKPSHVANDTSCTHCILVRAWNFGVDANLPIRKFTSLVTGSQITTFLTASRDNSLPSILFRDPWTLLMKIERMWMTLIVGSSVTTLFWFMTRLFLWHSWKNTETKLGILWTFDLKCVRSQSRCRLKFTTGDHHHRTLFSGMAGKTSRYEMNSR